MRHFIIPDTQCKPGNDFSHLTAAGNYIVAKQPEVIVHLGDHWDMPSLSDYDKGKKSYEGRRYSEDIRAGHDGMLALFTPIRSFNDICKKHKRKQYRPKMYFLTGNHEQRISRAIERDAILDGTIGYQDFRLEEYGWEWVDFLKPIEIDGIYYSHYFYNPNTGHPYGGKASTKLNNIGFSFVMGHQQGLDMAMKHLANGKTLRGLVAGSFYQHKEEYKGYQGNDHWHGCLMLNEVKDGEYCLMELSLEYLMKEWL